MENKSTKEVSAFKLFKIPEKNPFSEDSMRTIWDLIIILVIIILHM